MAHLERLGISALKVQPDPLKIANKAALLMVLERPEVPLNTTLSENDIRACVTRRKISGGTKSETGKQARDSFLGPMKTCQKLGIPFRDYLGHRLKVPNANHVPRSQTSSDSVASKWRNPPGAMPRLPNDLVSAWFCLVIW